MEAAVQEAVADVKAAEVWDMLSVESHTGHFLEEASYPRWRRKN